MIDTRDRQTKRLLAPFIGLFLLLLGLYAGGVAGVVLVAALLAYILGPLVTALELRGFSRGAATGVLFLFLGLAGALVWQTLVPVAADQFHELRSGTASEQTATAIERLQEIIRHRLSFLGLGDLDLMQEIDHLKASVAGTTLDFLLTDSVALLVNLALIPFLMFFFLRDGRLIKKYFISLVPNRYFEFTMDLLHKMDRQLGNYMRGQFIVAVVFGLMATSVLWALEVPYFVFIGMFAGLANLIPFVGPIAGALAALFVAVLKDGDLLHGGLVIVAFAALKLVDDFVVQPLAVGRTVDLHPMVVALGIIAGGRLFGILGMLLAVPLLGFFKVVLEESIGTFRKYRFG